ncbi:NAD-dependent epimerase/dehydratase family protein [Candidatus Palauibacter irciniicola]|uniref:NAD-dependent epimerase/dehydratase family protein n=1 Tax=Candidatus Palauibacter irciniicola TaxID=3056733 RepID=UPI003B02E3BF
MTPRRRWPPHGPVLVTGANGYVASWLVKRLLEQGFDVHGTVRDPRDPVKTGHLRAMARDLPGTLSLFRADLLDPGGFDRAMAGCPLVFHTASPLIVRDVDDPVRDLIEPATRGTRHVLEAADRTPAVRRVVLTSSIVAIYGDAADLEQIEADRFDESHWNTTSHEGHQPYSYSKTLSERLAWKMAEEQARWDLVVVNPGLVLGPGLSRNTNAEGVLIMRDLGNGAHRVGAPELEFAIVDVRDVAEGHLQAGLIPEAEGRYILVGETRSLIEIAGILRERFGDGFPSAPAHGAQSDGHRVRAPGGDPPRRGEAQRGVSPEVRERARQDRARHDLPSRRGDHCESLSTTAERRSRLRAPGRPPGPNAGVTLTSVADPHRLHVHELADRVGAEFAPVARAFDAAEGDAGI